MVAVAMQDTGVLPPWTVEGHKDPKAWFLAMHKRGPIHRDEQSGVWMFVGWKAVRDFLSQPKVWSTAKRIENVDETLRVIRLLTSDPPLHLKLRSFFVKAYRPDRILQIEQRIRQVCNDLMRDCLAKGTFDVVGDYLKPLAVITICELIGIPPGGEKTIKRVTGNTYLGGLAPAASNPSVLTMLNPGTSNSESLATVNAYFSELVALRRAAPQDDLISELTRIQPSDLNGQVDIPALLFEQFGAGTNTTVHLFTSLVHELFMRPELHRRVRADRSLMEPMIDETLRLHSPLQARPRVLTRDIELCGETVREGATALGWLAAANVDPAEFADPLAFDIDRPRRDHIAFGRHEHFCLGTHLARMELRTALDVWLDNIEVYEPATGIDVPWIDDFILHGADQYKVTIMS